MSVFAASEIASDSATQAKQELRAATRAKAIADAAAVSPWFDVDQSCAYVGACGKKIIYNAIADGRLRAAHVDGRRKIIIHRDWLDAWLTAAAPAVVEVARARGAA